MSLGSGGKEIGERFLDKIATHSDAVSGDRYNISDETCLWRCVMEHMSDVDREELWDRRKAGPSARPGRSCGSPISRDNPWYGGCRMNGWFSRSVAVSAMMCAW